MKKQEPEEGRHLEVPETDDEPLDPLLEDHRSADVVLKMTISWTRWQTTWPRDGSET